MVKNVTPDERLRLAIIENIQRADLNPIEEAAAYAALIDEFNFTQEQCALKLGKERATIANAVRLLALPNVIQEDLISGRLSQGHGKALLALSDNKNLLTARKIILKRGLNVRQTEQICQALKKGGEPGGTGDKKLNPDLEYIAENLRSHLRTKVKLSGSGSRGKIEISYFSAAELERVLGLVGGNSF